MNGWNGWNVLHTAAARVGGLDLGFTPGEGGKSAGEMVGKGALYVLLLLGADEIHMEPSPLGRSNIGDDGDANAGHAVGDRTARPELEPEPVTDVLPPEIFVRPLQADGARRQRCMIGTRQECDLVDLGPLFPPDDVFYEWKSWRTPEPELFAAPDHT